MREYEILRRSRLIVLVLSLEEIESLPECLGDDEVDKRPIVFDLRGCCPPSNLIMNLLVEEVIDRSETADETHAAESHFRVDFILEQREEDL